jgi:hypothetical protein
MGLYRYDSLLTGANFKGTDAVTLVKNVILLISLLIVSMIVSARFFRWR